jgi:UDP-N-acetylmuramoyl-L-alanyl-D-glutamate--2,6-diaminopimelate ligase
LHLLNLLRKIIPEDSKLRLFYSWSKAVLAKALYFNPSKDLFILGVTGTDGKTSTVHFTAQLLELLGKKVAMASTEEIWIAGEKKENKTKRTTLSPLYIQKFLKEAKEKECEVVVLEVSSHALVQGRVFGIDFNAGIVTNISQEHCNYHKSLREYALSKLKLFELVEKSPKSEKLLLVNKNMQFYDFFANINSNLTKTYALNTPEADYSAEELLSFEDKSCFKIAENADLEFNLNVAGTYNVENILAAMALARFLGFSLTEIHAKLPKVRSVSGRLEPVEVKAPYKVFVDFALTPGAFKKLLDYGRKITKNKLWIVFGCTGADHDQIKRPQMGETAEKLADFLVLTEDETYGEDNQKIVDDIKRGFSPEMKHYKVIHDRKEAIFYALKNAEEGDTIFITGMGNFTSRNNGKEEIPWSDRDTVKSYFLKK